MQVDTPRVCEYRDGPLSVLPTLCFLSRFTYASCGSMDCQKYLCLRVRREVPLAFSRLLEQVPWCMDGLLHYCIDELVLVSFLFNGGCVCSTKTKYKKRADFWVHKTDAKFFKLKTCKGWNCKYARRNAYTGKWFHPQTAQAGPTSIRTGPSAYLRIPGTNFYDIRIQIPAKLCASLCWQATTCIARKDT